MNILIIKHPEDKDWFDKKEVYKQLEENLIARINSESLGYKKDTGECAFHSPFI